MQTLRLRGSLFLLAVVVMFGCGSTKKKSDPSDSGKATKSTSSTSSSSSSSSRRDGLIWSSRAYPTGDKRTSTLLLESGTPAEVTAGKSYNYVIKVTNLTDLNLDNVIVEDKPEGNFKLESASPNAKTGGGGMRWNLGNLRPNGSKTITVTGRPLGTGAVTHCCEVDWRSVVCNTTQVVQPKLSLVKTGTKAALICDPIIYKMTVTNDGSGPARNVVINAPLPKGITTMDGKTSQRINVGTLNAGQSKDYTVRAKANKTGRFNCHASAKADGGLSSKSGTVTTVVTQPKLTISKKAPSRAFQGKNINYKITVKNVGNGVAKDATITDELPSGAKFVSASSGGSLRGSNVVWNLGTLKPNETREVTLRVRPTGGKIINRAVARAYCAEAVSSQTETMVTGRPAILLEVIDVEDPIEVGGEVTYVIEATNQGTADGTNITITCRLEKEAKFVSAGGATNGSHSGGTIKFQPLPRLQPKAKARWRVVVKADGEGDIRFSVAMNSDQLTRPVEENEATQFYK